METLLEGLKQLIEAYVGNYGWLAAFVTWVGTARLIFKPIMTAIESIVAATDTKEDDKRLEEIKKSKVYYWLLYFLDYFASIKAPVMMKGKK